MSDSPIISSAAFRALMRNVPGQVTIIATGARGHRKGLTATAVCALSDSPPTVLVCVNRLVGAHDTIIENGMFSINALAAGQDDIAVMFSGRPGVKGESRFKSGDWTTGSSGAPVLAGALCTLECRMSDYRPAATHTIFFGEVVAGAALHDADPLLYLRGAYTSV